MNTLKKGDFIKCRDKDDLIYVMEQLQKEGIETDFCYHHKNEDGYWLEVTKVDKQ